MLPYLERYQPQETHSSTLRCFHKRSTSILLIICCSYVQDTRTKDSGPQ